MAGMTSAWKAFCVTSMTFALVSAAQASTTRTFVSNTGSDSNNCRVTTPCATLLAAYNQTLSGGEIVIMNPGGYGPLTITHALTIIGTPGATLTASAAGPVGITITAAASDVIMIRDLEITGANAPGTTGIQLNSGHLVLLNSSVKLLGTGLDIRSIADISNTNIVGNTIGIATTGTGTDIYLSTPTWGTTQARLYFGNVVENTTAFVMNNPGASASGNMRNKITIEVNNSQGGYSTNIAGNGTLASGTGASCASYQTPDPSPPPQFDTNPNCNVIYQYQSQATFQVPNGP